MKEGSFLGVASSVVRGVSASLGVKGVSAGFGLLAKCIAKLSALTPRLVRADNSFNSSNS